MLVKLETDFASARAEILELLIEPREFMFIEDGPLTGMQGPTKVEEPDVAMAA